MRGETKRLLIGPNEDAMLRGLYRYHHLTSRQVCRLLRFSPKSIEHIQGKLKRLVEAGYLERTLLPHRSRGGMGAYVYNLSRTGMQYLADDGLEIPTRARPYAEREHKYLFLMHSLEVSDMLIAAELLSTQEPVIEIARMLHERDLRHTPTKVRVSGPNRTPTEVTYVPDGYLDLHVYTATPYRTCLGLEIDRGTEIQGKWRRKVQAMLAYQRGPYQEAFGTDVLTVCVIATTGGQRLRNLLRWTEAELAAQGRPSSADLFRFTALPLNLAVPEEERPTPGDIFLGPRWLVPGSTQPVALLDGFD